VPYPPGGATDIVARVVAPRLSEVLGQTVTVENKTGANGHIGTQFVARQPADGYTLVMGNTGAIAVSPLVSTPSELGYDPIKDLVPVRMLMKVPNVLVTSNAFPAKNFQEFQEQARQAAAPVSLGIPGHLSSPHLSAESMRLQTGVKLSLIPYRGSAPAMTDLLGNQIPVLFDNVPALVQHIREGKVRALAITAASRSALLPNVPTFNELGLKGLEVSGWSGLMAPAGTPAPVIAKVNEALDKVMRQPEVAARFAKLFLEIPDSSPQQFKDFIAEETVRWRRVVTEAKLTANP